MSQPASRVLAVLELLQSRGRVSGAELAQRLQVDRRTVRRYIAALEDMGMPITAERGRDGAYRLMPGFKLPPMMFSVDEALALSLGLVAAREIGLAQGARAVASAQAKLERVLPDKVQQRARAVNETLMLDLRRPAVSVPADLLGIFSAAAQTQQRIAMRYRSPQQGETEREVDPYGLAYYSGFWYVVGWCHLRRGMRSFRLDRVAHAEPLPKSFARPAGFDALAHLRQAAATRPRAFTVKVLLDTDLVSAQQELFAEIGMLEWIDSHRRRGVLLTSQVDDLDWFARELARLPFAFRILEPAKLKRALAAHLARVNQALVV